MKSFVEGIETELPFTIQVLAALHEVSSHKVLAPELKIAGSNKILAEVDSHPTDPEEQGELKAGPWSGTSTIAACPFKQNSEAHT